MILKTKLVQRVAQLSFRESQTIWYSARQNSPYNRATLVRITQLSLQASCTGTVSKAPDAARVRVAIATDSEQKNSLR